MQGNMLFPVFLRLDRLHILIVGGGKVGLEKISSLWTNSPNASIRLVAPEIDPEIEQLALQNPDFLKLSYKEYQRDDLANADIVIAATCIRSLNHQIWSDAKSQRIIVNVADTPELCDFYMCSVVKKGDLKIGISSNGLSPTITKRVRELLEEVIPDSIDDLLHNLRSIRDRLKGDFEYKVQKMNELTSIFTNKKN